MYEEGRDDSKDDDDALLPQMELGDRVNLLDLLTNQHFTEPPPRYSEATLVKALTEFDIGRPSTYAAIIHTLQQREYVIVDKKRFVPTDVGRVVSKFLTEYFTRYVDYQFTAQLEDTLDAIARGEQEWVPVLYDFWEKFDNQIREVDESVKRKDVTSELLTDLCPKCDKPSRIGHKMLENGRKIRICKKCNEIMD